MIDARDFQTSLGKKEDTMQKTILITGSTDGIGLETAKMLVSAGHRVLLHGRNPAKLKHAKQMLSALPGEEGLERRIETYVADLSRMEDVTAFATSVAKRNARLDVLINNAGVYGTGVYGTSDPITPDGLDVRFAVNTIAPYLLTQRLLPLLGASGRVINVSSAAQAPVDPDALTGRARLSDGAAYAQSKLALTMWSRALALSLKGHGPVIVAVNPGSLLGTKMVKDAYGVPGGDIRIGAEILVRAALADEFATASGQYFDNDQGEFASPHPHASDAKKCEEIVRVIAGVLVDITP